MQETAPEPTEDPDAISEFYFAWLINPGLSYLGQGWANDPSDWWRNVLLYHREYTERKKQHAPLTDKNGKKYVDFFW